MPRALLVAVLLTSAPLYAETVVLEAYAGKRPDDAASLLRPLYDELRGLGYLVASPELSRRIDEKLSRRAGPMGAVELAETHRLVEGGWRAWLDGELEPAAEQLGQALARYQQNPASVAQAPELRNSIYRALVGLALARKRQGRADEAAAHMAELVRSFPDRDFNRTQYGPEAHELYGKVKRELEEQRRGRLRITVDDESAVVFLNERYDSVGGGDKEVLPGRYRVYAQKGATPGRLRIVDVPAGGAVDVRVGWRLDAALVTSDGFVGLVGVGPRDSHPTTLARTLGADGVVVLTIDEYEGRRAIIGRVLAVDSAKPSRAAVVALEPAAPGEDSIRGLGRFLAEGTPGPGIIVPGEDPEGPPAGDAEAWYADGLGWGLAAGGVVLAGVGAGLLVQAGSLRDDAGATSDETREMELRESADLHELWGTFGIIAGGALIAGGIVKLVLHDRGSPDSPRTSRAIVTPFYVGLETRF